MKKILLAALMAFTGITYSQTPVWMWATAQGGRTNSDGSVGIARDVPGNIYTIADFEGTQTIGPNTFVPLGFLDIFVSKADPVGNILWSVQFGGQNNFGKAAGIAVDANGYTYIVGSFTYIMTIGANTFTSFGQKDIFLAKLDPAGNVVWSRQIGGTGDDDPSALVVSGANLYMVGGYTQTFVDGTVTFPASFNNSMDIFYSKYDTTGACLSVSRFGGIQGDKATSLSVSGSSIYMAGYLADTLVAFGSTMLYSKGANDIFVTKLDASGVPVWAKSAGKSSNDIAYGVSQDGAGDCFIGGVFYGNNVSFGTGVMLSESQGYGDGFLVKYNGSTGAAVWARKVSSPQVDQTIAISTDTQGSTFITGYFNNTAVLSSAVTPTISLATLGGNDAFFAKYNGNGNLIWANRLGSTNADVGKAIICDNNGYCSVTGNFYGTVTVGSLPSIVSTVGSFSVFSARINGFTTGLSEAKDAITFSMYPNPAHGETKVNTGKDPVISYELYSISGQLMASENFVNPVTEFSINLDQMIAGNYLLTVKTKSGASSKMLKVD